ncbi:MAG: DNA gyrase inhibitor YacG [Xanthobacteraceae bacterium]
MSERAEAPPTKPCPVCGKPSVPEFRPFCTRRCANVDLNRWLGGVYAVPVKDDEDEDGAAKGEDDS